ncbi:MAG: transposase, partial [Streptosporangiaceae bacterium]
MARLALALAQARHQLNDNHAQLLAIVNDIAPGLTSRYGVGPVSAAQAIVSFSHPGRCRSEAAFAALGGTSPIPASSGRAIRHRLNRGSDRALNRAIHAIALTRIRNCPRTRAYIPRRTARGEDRTADPPLPHWRTISGAARPGRGSPVVPGDGHVAVPPVTASFSTATPGAPRPR